MSLEPLTGFHSLSLNVAAASRATLLPKQGLQFADFWSTHVNFKQKYFYWKLGIKLSLCMRMMPQKCLHPWRRREAPSILMSGLHTGLVTMRLHPFRHSGGTLNLELPWHWSLGWAGMSCFVSLVRDQWFGCCMSAHPCPSRLWEVSDNLILAQLCSLAAQQSCLLFILALQHIRELCMGTQVPEPCHLLTHRHLNQPCQCLLPEGPELPGGLPATPCLLSMHGIKHKCWMLCSLFVLSLRKRGWSSAG